MIKTTYSKIKTLNHYNGPVNYVVMEKETVTKVKQCKIPYETWYHTEFPKYLKGFEQYYNKVVEKNFWGGVGEYWKLKDEYKENRPMYSIVLTYDLLTIELTEEGKTEVERRYEMHKRNMEKYASLLG